MQFYLSAIDQESHRTTKQDFYIRKYQFMIVNYLDSFENVKCVIYPYPVFTVTEMDHIALVALQSFH